MSVPVATIRPEPGAVHFDFSPDRAPIVTINSGDTVRFQTLDAGGNFAPDFDRPRDQRRRFPRPLTPDGNPQPGHALCGPVAIRGAEPGMTLAIRIDALRPVTWGWTEAGGWPHWVNNHLNLNHDTDALHLDWTLDPDALTGVNQFGQRVKLRPFLGVLGMPPAEPGSHPTAPPRITGGNLDCRELVAGSTLYLPIAVAGGCFSTGDGHAAQGDGEVSVTAIECGMEIADLTFTLHPDLHLSTPRAHTPAGWLTFGLSADLNQATLIALAAMIDLMVALFDMPRNQALGLASIVVHLRITQIANGVCGVHALLPHHAFDQVR